MQISHHSLSTLLFSLISFSLFYPSRTIKKYYNHNTILYIYIYIYIYMHLHRHTYTRPHMIHKYINTHTCTYIYKTYITIYTYTCIFKYRHTHIYIRICKNTHKSQIYIYIYLFYTSSKLLMNENTQFCFDTTRVLCLLTIFRSIFISFLKTKYKIFSKKTKLIEKYIYVIYPFSTNFNSGLL